MRLTGHVNDPHHLLIKLSGDGTKLGKRIHLVNTAFALIGSENACETYILVVVKTGEKYEDIKFSLKETIEGIRPIAEASVFW